MMVDSVMATVEIARRCEAVSEGMDTARLLARFVGTHGPACLGRLVKGISERMAGQRVLDSGYEMRPVAAGE